MIRARTMREEIALYVLLVVLIAAASHAVVLFVKMPVKKAVKELATVPVAWELKVRDAVKGYLAGDSRVYENSVVDSAMSTIIARFLPALHDTMYPISVMVVESDVVNAVTFPGGLIVVFTPLIKLADSPEEVAGVIAHELGHVEHRDPVHQMVREIGASAILAMVNGGKTPPMVGNLVHDFIDARYSQAQESAADSFAVKLLARSGIDPVVFADFLTKIEADSSSASASREVAGYFNSHPGTGERIAKAREASKLFDRKARRPLDIDWFTVKKNLPSAFD